MLDPFTFRGRKRSIQSTASTCAAVVVSLLDAGVGARYCWKLIRRESHPRLATWLIFEIGVVMSLAAYFASHDHSVVKASLNLTDAIVVTAIVAAILIEQRGAKILFTRNEQLCLAISLITLAAWAITRTAWIGFTGFQIVMSVAYGPTIENLWRARPGSPPEPIDAWSVNALAAFIGIFVDVTGNRDYIAMLYPLRAFLLCVIIVALVIRWKKRAIRHN